MALVFCCGALLPLQTGLNARLGKSIGSPIYASLLSFVVGALAVLIYLPFTTETLNLKLLKSASITSLLGGGIIGALFITLTMLALRTIGMALTFSLVIAGQIILAVFLDHFKILVSEQHPFNAWRMAGILMIILGVIIVQKF